MAKKFAIFLYPMSLFIFATDFTLVACLYKLLQLNAIKKLKNNFKMLFLRLKFNFNFIFILKNEIICKFINMLYK